MTKKTTIRLEIRSIGSPDIELYSWEPTTNADVIFLVEMEIGEAGVVGADLFQVVVATPEALRANSKTTTNIIRERSTLVVSNYDWQETQKTIESIVRKCEAENWIISTLNLQRYFKWEYEDYQTEGKS
jgi:hypothetical protein